MYQKVTPRTNAEYHRIVLVIHHQEAKVIAISLSVRCRQIKKIDGHRQERLSVAFCPPRWYPSVAQGEESLSMLFCSLLSMLLSETTIKLYTQDRAPLLDFVDSVVHCSPPTVLAQNSMVNCSGYHRLVGHP